ncbi:MAG: serine/threonine protein phosphatase PrpC [Colwellia sp.]|jgi:serine/threonine protein phosphatase PrpC
MNKISWVSVAKTDVGTVRKVNEDSYLEKSDSGVWCVADGMGGHARGDVASQMITQQLSQLVKQSKNAVLIDHVVGCLQGVNTKLVTLSQQHQSIVGSTVAVLLLEQNKAHCIWAGDSRIYRIREGEIQRITRDHSQVEEMIDAGLIKAEEADSHPKSNIITRAVGASSQLDLEIRTYDLKLSDKFILCSDGLNNVFSDQELAQTVLSTSLDLITEHLIEEAIVRKARDNVTVLIVENKNILDADEKLKQTIALDMTLPFNNSMQMSK